jgi:hypothetical protein
MAAMSAGNTLRFAAGISSQQQLPTGQNFIFIKTLKKNQRLPIIPHAGVYDCRG